MDIFLEKDTVRLLKILDEYFLVKNEWSIAEVANKMGCTYRTAQSDFERIKQIIELDRFKKVIRFEIYNKGTIKIEVKNDFDYNLFKQYFLEQSISYQFIEDLILEQPLNKTNFEKKYFISYPNFKKKYSYLFQILKAFNLEVNTASRFELAGSEKQIRYFAVCFLIGTLNYCGKVPTHDTFLAVDKRYTEILSVLNKKMEYKTSINEKYRVMIMVFVSKIRFAGCHYYEPDQVAYSVDEYTTFSMIYKIMFDWISEYIKEEGTIKTEVAFLFSLFNLFPANESGGEFHDKVISKYLDDKFVAYRMSKIIIDTIEEKYGDFSRKEQITLYGNLLSFQYQITHFLGDMILFSDTTPIIENYSDKLIYQLIDKNYNQLYNRMLETIPADNIEIFKKNAHFLKLKYHNTLRIGPLAKKTMKSIHIKIISSQGEMVEKELFNLIVSNLNEFNFTFEAHITNTTDIIVTDIILPSLQDIGSNQLFIWQGKMTELVKNRLREYIIKNKKNTYE